MVHRTGSATEVGTITRIYALLDPSTSDVRYVGKTTLTLSNRLSMHCTVARRRRRTYISQWVGSVLATGQRPLIVELEVVEGDGWGDAERRWIAYYRSQGARLANLSDGGEGGATGWKATPETRARMSAAQRGRPKSPEHVEAVRRALAGRKTHSPSAETRAKLSAALIGRPKSAEHAAAIGRSRQGEKSSTARLTADQVTEIRARVACGETQLSLSRSFGVGPDHVSRIVSRQVWKHLTD